MIKVIGFDAWTRGASHYQRLVVPFREKGLELSLVHLGSWGDEKGRPAAERITGLLVRDISSYGGITLDRMLDQERPAAIVLTSVDSFANRALIRYCRRRRIPTVHLFHGLQRVVADGSYHFDSKAHRRMWLLRRMVWKGVTRFWPAYIRALLKTGASVEDWRRFAEDLVTRARGRRPARAADDSRADKACTFIASEASWVSRVYGYPDCDIVPVGNPDLIKFGLGERELGFALDRAPTGTDVIYIDGALINYGWIYDSERAFVDHLVSTRNALADQGSGFVFKPHPTHDEARLRRIREAGIEICPPTEFVPRLRRSAAAITEPSSAGVVPALMGLPLLLANYGPLQGQVFGEIFRSYPRGQELGRIEDFGATMANERAALDAASVRAWIGENAGPVPFAAMPSRVADVILSLLTPHAGEPRPSVT